MFLSREQISVFAVVAFLCLGFTAACGGTSGGGDDDSSGNSSGSSLGSLDGLGGNTSGSSTTGGGSTSEHETCSDLGTCGTNCSTDECNRACYRNASASAQSKMRSFVACMENNGCDSDACACRHCADEMATCFPGYCDSLRNKSNASDPNPSSSNSCVVQTSMNCSQLVDCTTCCTSDSCVKTCGRNSTQTALDRYNRLMECAEQNGCFSSSAGENCLRNYCLDELRTCAGSG